MVDVAVLEVDSIAITKVYSSAGALIDLGIYDLDGYSRVRIILFAR